MAIFFPALFCFIFSSFALAENTINEPQNTVPETVGCENPYLENTAQLKSYVEECLREFEARQKCRRPFIFWNKSKTISTHWIPFSKGINIGRKCFKTFTKAEIKALLSSSFQKFGGAKPFILYFPLACVGSFISLLTTFFVVDVVANSSKAYFINSLWFSEILVGGVVVAGIVLMAIVIMFCSARISVAPLCESDSLSIKIYGGKDTLLSALTKAKDEEVIIRQAYLISSPSYSRRSSSGRESTAVLLVDAAISTANLYSYFFAGHADAPKALNTWSSYDVRIENLKKMDKAQVQNKSISYMDSTLQQLNSVSIPEIRLLA